MRSRFQDNPKQSQKFETLLHFVWKITAFMVKFLDEKLPQMCTIFHENRLGITKNIINFLSRFVLILRTLLFKSHDYPSSVC